MACIQELVKLHSMFRKKTVNLIASENLISPAAREVLSEAHLSGRYHAGFYGGVEHIEKILNTTSEMMEDLFRVERVILSPQSGNLAVLASLFAFSQQGDEVAILDLSGGGYPLNLNYFGRKKLELVFNEETLNINIDQTLSLLEQRKPPLVFLGASLIVFPQPVKEVASTVSEYGGTVVYDGSHVLGLIAGRQFQDPIREGADVLIGSTHKSFPGPQGGVILTSNEQKYQKLQTACNLEPVEGIVLVDNPHPARIAALGVVVEELLRDSRAVKYARTVVENSKTLAKSLDKEGYIVKGKNFGFTESHQVLSKIENFEKGAEKRDLLQEHGIISDAALRFGTAEVTRLGYGKTEMEEIGSIIAGILSKDYRADRDKEALRKRVKELVKKYDDVVL